MRAARLALAATACMIPLTALTAVPANAEQSTPTLEKVRIKTVCRDDGNTRVRVRVTVSGDPLVDYSYRIGNGDARVGDVLLEGDGTWTLVAFTIPARSQAVVSVSDGNTGIDDKVVQARRC